MSGSAVDGLGRQVGLEPIRPSVDRDLLAFVIRRVAHPAGREPITYYDQKLSDVAHENRCALWNGETRLAAPAHPPKSQSGQGRSWQPLSARLGGTRIDETWQEGVPSWIKPAVRRWLTAQLNNSTVRSRLYARLHYQSFDDSWGLVDPVESLNDEHLLDWVDGVLHLNVDERPEVAGLYAQELETLLLEGHSIWKISADRDALERRQDATVTAAAQRASDSASSLGRAAASEHLSIAWRETYGMQPDPSKAYSEAILAVEAIARYL